MRVFKVEGFSNTYVITCGEEAIVIDPGNPYSSCESFLKGVDKLAVIITHGHFDHYFHLEEYTFRHKCVVYMNERDLPIVESAPMWVKEYFGLSVSYIPTINAHLKEGNTIKIGKVVLTVLEIPGHSPGSIALVGDGFLFTGDLMFENGGIGRTDLPGGDEKALFESIKRVLSFPENYIVYPGHGKDFSIKEAKSWFHALWY